MIVMMTMDVIDVILVDTSHNYNKDIDKMVCSISTEYKSMLRHRNRSTLLCRTRGKWSRMELRINLKLLILVYHQAHATPTPMFSRESLWCLADIGGI